MKLLIVSVIEMSWLAHFPFLFWLLRWRIEHAHNVSDRYFAVQNDTVQRNIIRLISGSTPSRDSSADMWLVDCHGDIIKQWYTHNGLDSIPYGYRLSGFVSVDAVLALWPGARSVPLCIIKHSLSPFFSLAAWFIVRMFPERRSSRDFCEKIVLRPFIAMLLPYRLP